MSNLPKGVTPPELKKTLFVKGQKGLYGEWLDKLTPEERVAHFIAKKQKANMKRAFNKLVEAQSEKWLAQFNNKAAELLATANAQDFAILHDRLIGRPVEKTESTVDAVVTAVDVDFKD